MLTGLEVLFLFAAMFRLHLHQSGSHGGSGWLMFCKSLNPRIQGHAPLSALHCRTVCQPHMMKGKVAKNLAGYLAIVNALLAIYGIKKFKYMKPYIPDIVKILTFLFISC